MIATLSNSYMIATRMDGFLPQTAARPARRSKGSLLARLWRRYRAAQETRKDLATLDARLMADAGLTEAEVDHLANRPFWDYED